MTDQSDAPHFDPKDFSNDTYVKRVEKPWGYELHFAQENLPYMSKLMHINGGTRESLQVHDTKQETYVLTSGEAELLWENVQGEMISTKLEKFVGYHTSVGQKHRLVAITDCDIMETSTPEAGTTWRLEDDYDRPDETPEERKLERNED